MSLDRWPSWQWVRSRALIYVLVALSAGAGFMAVVTAWRFHP